MARQRHHRDAGPGHEVDRERVAEAAGRISGKVRRTPVVSLEPGALGIPGELTLKLEHLQHTGSFKPRGATNRLLSAEVPGAGVVAASGGNHGAAVAYAARALGYGAEIFVPEISSPVKVRRLEGYGAKLTISGKNYAEALAASRERAEKTGALVVHAYDQPEIVAGQGTVAKELSEQAPDLDTVLVAVGGGGLIGGMAAWYAGGTRLVGVEPELAPSMSRAFGAGEPVEVEVGGIAADALGARRVGGISYSLSSRFVESVALVDERSIRETQRLLWEELRLALEPAGAVAPAALVSGAYRPGRGERVGVLLCGGNVDPSTLAWGWRIDAPHPDYSLADYRGWPTDRGRPAAKGRACVLEYNVVRWGRTELPPEAGVGIYVRGDGGKLAAGRIYDDSDPPL